MIIDYLRYLAFNGRLSGFFTEAWRKYVKTPEHCTGLHLRYSEKAITELGTLLPDGPTNNPPLLASIAHRWPHVVLEHLGIRQHNRPAYSPGRPPPTLDYSGGDPALVDIVVDIDPEAWPKYANDERQNYEGSSIIFQPASPAVAQLSAGDRVFDVTRGPHRAGTICGVFRSDSQDKCYALTCGHVVATGNEARLPASRSTGFFSLLRSSSSPLGTVRWTASPEADPRHLDAALIELPPRDRSNLTDHLSVRPITAIAQEEHVRFRGRGRNTPTLARVAMVSARKWIKLFRDKPDLFEVGDVLVLGHRKYMHWPEALSTRGDSGAAVHADNSTVEDWHGMVLGGDQNGTYVSYAELLRDWAASQIGDPYVEFHFDV